MTPCIEWTGARKDGYGIKHRPEGGSRLVHRIEWERHNGAVPDGMFVCHHCDNPPCYNIEHLFLGTPSDNMWDKTFKGRHHYAKRTHCCRGHEFAGDNLRMDHGARRCKTCARERLIEWRQARREASASVPMS